MAIRNKSTRLIFLATLTLLLLGLYLVLQPMNPVEASPALQATIIDPLAPIPTPSVSDSTPQAAVDAATQVADPVEIDPTTDNALLVTPAPATDVPAETTSDPAPTDELAATEDVLTTLEAAPITPESTAEATDEAVVTAESSAEATIEATAIVVEALVDEAPVPEANVEALAIVPMADVIVPLAVIEPDVELGVTCPSPNVASFTLRNVGGDMLAAGQYTVSNPASSQSFQLASGQSISFQAAGDANVSANYTTSTGGQVSLGATGQCIVVPTATHTPSPTSAATRTPTNTPGPTNTATITRTPTNTLVPSLTFTPSLTYTPSLTFTPSNTPTITLTPTNTLTPTITLTPTNTLTPTITLTPTNTLTPTITLTPTNTLTPTITLTPTNTFTPSPTATLQPGTSLVELNVACLPAAPGVTPDARFRLRNVGGDMLTPGVYTLSDPTQPVQNASFQLAAGETFDLIAAGDSKVDVVYSTLTFANVALGVTGTCLAVPTPIPSSTPTNPPATDIPATSVPMTSVPVVPTDAPTVTFVPSPSPTRQPSFVIGQNATSTPISGTSVPASTPDVCGEAVETSVNGFPVLDVSGCAPQDTVIEPPTAWTPITVGGAVCTDWMIYHTDMTGDWEIFRLGELPDGVQADVNLSRGVGSRVYDVMPSRSPDQKWITFASNRESNWDIYISAVEQDDIQRITFTPNAVEVDPVWSPVDGQIVYESNRDGNWNLYLFNVADGVEKRLTSSTANEINATWSPDGSSIVYQDDSAGFWQLYELTIDNLETRLLSDTLGDDHSPQFAHDGKHIVFFSLRDGENSVIYMMDTDGSNVMPITDPAGNARNHAWSPDDSMVAYQSNLDGDEDIYVYDVATQTTRLLTENTVDDYAPTWYCDAPTVAFTSDVVGDANIFAAGVLPISAPPINILQQASQLTFDTAADQYPVDSPSEENASRQDSLPSPIKNK